MKPLGRFNSPLLELKDVSLKVAEKILLDQVSLIINKGDFISLSGPSAAGKSTFFRVCSNLLSPTSGDIFFKGNRYEDYCPLELRKNIAYCCQNSYLFGNTVMDNMIFPYFVRHLEPDLKRIHFLLELFQMSEDYLKRPIDKLSGGEKQKIALIRSLIFMPEMLLLDEITSALDRDNAKIVEDIIHSLNTEGITIMWITHQPEQIKKYANKLLTINAGKIISFKEAIQ